MATLQNIMDPIIETEPNQPLADSGYVPVSNNLATITSDRLTPSVEIPYSEPSTAPVYPVASLDATLPMLPTQEETQANDLSTRLQALNEQLIGQSAYRAQQEQAQGIPELMKTQTDLTSQLKALQNEAQAIPLAVQNELTGRASVGRMDLESRARSRENAIQALSVSSLLEASRGNLATAQTLVDRAVAQRFDPIREEIAAKTANLQLILESPAYSLSQKNRAQRQLEIQQAREKEVAQQEADAKAIMQTATEAAKLGADPVTLQRIQNAASPDEALRIATEAGVYQSQEEKELALSGFVKINDPAQLSGLTEDQIIRMPNGDIWKKPPEARNTDIIVGGGNTLLVDTNTGEVIANFGSAYKETGGGGGGSYALGGGTDLSQVIATEAPSFEEYVQAYQDQYQMSVDPETLRDEYETYVNDLESQRDNIVNQVLSPTARSVYKNPSSIYNLTPTAYEKVINELETNGLSIETLNQSQENKLRKEFQGQVKDFVLIRDSFKRIEAAANNPSAAGDLALIFNYMKILDPGSVVRESEFATAQNAAGVPDRIRAQYNKVLAGERLAPNTRTDFVNKSKQLYNSKLESHNMLVNEYSDLAARQGINPENVVLDYVGQTTTPEQAQSIGDYLQTLGL